MKNLLFLSLIAFLYSFNIDKPKKNNPVIDTCDYLDEDQER